MHLQLTVCVFIRSVVPQISLASPLLDYARCFIGCPCTRHVELVNSTSLPARYEMQPQVSVCVVRLYICVCVCVCVCARARVCVCHSIVVYA